MRVLLTIAALCTAATAATARADYPVAPDVVVFCEPTLRVLIVDLGAQWRKETGIPLRVFAAPTWANLQQLARHARDDVMIGEGDAAAASAAGQDLINGETLLRLWRNHLVVAALTGELRKARARSPPAAFDLAAIAGRAPVAIVDPGVAQTGKDGERALRAVGMWAAVSAKSIGVVDTADAAFLLSEGGVELAVLYASDAALHRDFTVTDTLPDADPPTVYWAAQTARAMSPNAAKFLDFLRRPDVRARGLDAGLEVLP
ncbi:MAG: substrate-binding domain-containing protein [Alphaproteobacteria bacterium]|nr:substrate-binding domain-containing protein [Alphaproteobacteria bacterium]